MKNEISTFDKNKIRDLNQLNEEFENYFQSTIIPQLFFDKNLILRKYSPAAMKQFDLVPESVGKHLNELPSNLHYETLEEDIMKTMSLNQIVEKEVQTLDEKWYRMNVLPYIQQKEKIANGVIITFIDINNYVLSLKELQKMNSENEMFIYSVTHDLKAPLQNIDGLMDSLVEAINTNNLKVREQILNMLKSCASQMKNMISDLSRISRVNEDNRTKVRFKELMDEVYLTLKENIDEAKGKIECDFKVKEINFSRKDLRSIIYNLISNAIKYRSSERSIFVSVKTRREGNEIILSVKDNGRGIEEEKKGMIFSQFTRVIDNVEGTGIGLYLVSKIVDSQGGKVIINSKVNEGSEFIVYLKVYE